MYFARFALPLTCRSKILSFEKKRKINFPFAFSSLIRTFDLTVEG